MAKESSPVKPILISMPPDEERTDGLVAPLGCGTRAATEGAAIGRCFNPPEKSEVVMGTWVPDLPSGSR